MRIHSCVILRLLCMAIIGLMAIPAFAATNELISATATGAAANGDSRGVSISSDGQFVAFSSTATNLASNATTGNSQIYVRDRQKGTTEIDSVASDGTAGNGNSINPAISTDGRFVAFASTAPNLTPSITTTTQQVYVHDRQTGSTTMVSTAVNGVAANGISGSFGVAISGDGRYIAFDSTATNLVSGTTAGNSEIYVRDMQTGQVEIDSVANDGTPANGASTNLAISTDGTTVAFASTATNLTSNVPSGSQQVYIRNRTNGKTKLISTTNQGAPASGKSGVSGVSANEDGRFVAFDSTASDIFPIANGRSQIYVYDRKIDLTNAASAADDGSLGNGDSTNPAISRSGRFIAFSSTSTNLTPARVGSLPQVYVHDQLAASTELDSISANGTPGDGQNGNLGLAISARGGVVGFTSNSSNMVSGVTSSFFQIYAHSRIGTSILAGLAPDNSVWFTANLMTFYNVPGYLKTLAVSRQFIAGLAADNSIWVVSDPSGFQNIPGRLKTLSVGDFAGNGINGLAGLAPDGSIWYTPDLTNFYNVPGTLSTLVAADFNGNGKYGIAGLAPDDSIWISPDLNTLMNVPGRLRVLVVGNFAGNNKAELAGLASDGSIWYTRNLTDWTMIPGTLTKLVAGNFSGTGKDGLAGLAPDGSIWVTTDLTNFTNIPGYLKDLTVGDFNGDGRDDLAGVAADDSIWVTTDLTNFFNIPGRLSSVYSDGK